MCDSSGEPVVHSDEPRLPRAYVSSSVFEVGTPIPEKVVEKKKTKRAVRNPLTAALQSWLLSNLHCRFSIESMANFPSF